MDGFDSVMDAETQSREIFSTKLPTDLAKIVNRTHIPSSVVDNVVVIYNTGDIEKLDDYLLNEGDVSQDEREIIIESIFKFETQN